MPCWGSGGALGAEKRPHCLEGLAAARAQQAVIADHDKRVGRDMRPKPADDFRGTEGADRGVLGVGSFVLEDDRTPVAQRPPGLGLAGCGHGPLPASRRSGVTRAPAFVGRWEGATPPQPYV